MAYIEHLEGLGRSHYEVLGVGKDASLAEIKVSYRKKLLSTHPDKAKEITSATKDDIDSIQKAYKILSDDFLRKEYDESLIKSVQRAGFNISGDGLDSYSLDEFMAVEDDEIVYVKDCPRCQFPNSIHISESGLENGTSDGAGGYSLIVQCDSCSLWVVVKYYDGEEET